MGTKKMKKNLFRFANRDDPSRISDFCRTSTNDYGLDGNGGFRLLNGIIQTHDSLVGIGR